MTLLVYLGFALGAFLYSSVGHGGGSAYLALFALAGIGQGVAKPASLCLNILVSVIALSRFSQQEKLSQQLRPFPLLLGSVPAAFIGGGLNLPQLYRYGAGLLLLASSVLMWLDRKQGSQPENNSENSSANISANISADSPTDSPLVLDSPVALRSWHWFLIGASIGLVSGMTGTGGGIFLSAGLSFMGLASQRQLAQLASLFILCNSLAGLVGAHKLWPNLDVASLGLLSIFCLTGGVLGSRWGSRSLSERGLKRVLSVVLMIAAAKLMGLTPV